MLSLQIRINEFRSHTQQPVLPTQKSCRNFSWPLVNLPGQPYQSSLPRPSQRSDGQNKRSALAGPPTGTTQIYNGDPQNEIEYRQTTPLRSRTNDPPSVPKHVGGSQHQHAYMSELHTTLKRTRTNLASSEGVDRTVHRAPVNSVPGIQPQTRPQRDDTGATVHGAQGRAYTEHCVGTARQNIQGDSTSSMVAKPPAQVTVHTATQGMGSPDYQAGIGEYPSGERPGSICPASSSLVRASATEGGRFTSNMMASNTAQPHVRVHIDVKGKGKQKAVESADGYQCFQDSRSWRDV
jgi:hypothetical protein